MSQQVTLEEFDQYIEDLKEQSKLADALDRLQNNPDFQKIINETYLKDEAVRLVELRTDPSMQTPERQKDIDNGVIGVSNLRQFFIRINRFAEQADRSLVDANIERQAFIEDSQNQQE